MWYGLSCPCNLPYSLLGHSRGSKGLSDRSDTSHVEWILVKLRDWWHLTSTLQPGTLQALRRRALVGLLSLNPVQSSLACSSPGPPYCSANTPQSWLSALAAPSAPCDTFSCLIVSWFSDWEAIFFKGFAVLPPKQLRRTVMAGSSSITYNFMQS